MTLTERYAVQVMNLFLRNPARIIRAVDLADVDGISVGPTYLRKILRRLAGIGYLKSNRGIGGGYILNRRELTLAMVMRAVGDTVVQLQKCPFHPDSDGSQCCAVSIAQTALLSFLQTQRLPQ